MCVCDPKLPRLGRLTYEEDEDQYEKQAHVFCVQLAKDMIHVVDKLVRFHFQIFFHKFIK